MQHFMQQLAHFLAQHLILSSAFVAVLVLMAANELWTVLRGERQLGVVDAVRLINDRNAVVLDVRQAAEFKKGHIINALNIPVARLQERAAELNRHKEQTVICYCALGHAAPQAVAQLRKLGFGTVHSLKGGISAWQAASLPVTAK
jgi:rhodanese-related sulfurtransferase